MAVQIKELGLKNQEEFYDREPQVIPMICYTAAQEAVGNDWVDGLENLAVQRLPLTDEMNIPKAARRVFLWRYFNADIHDGGPDMFEKNTMGDRSNKK